MYPGTIDAVDEVVKYSVDKGKRVKLLPFLDGGFHNYSINHIKEIIQRLNVMDAILTYYEKEGVYLWTFKTGGAVKIIESPCYSKNIKLIKKLKLL